MYIYIYIFLLRVNNLEFERKYKTGRIFEYTVVGGSVWSIWNSDKLIIVHFLNEYLTDD